MDKKELKEREVKVTELAVNFCNEKLDEECATLGICRKGKCTRQQILLRRTAGSCPQHGTVPQMHTVKKAQCHSTFLCQRCSDALESFQARFRLSISDSFPHAVRPHSGLPVQFRRSCRLHRKRGTNPAPAERPPHGSVPA